MSIWYESENMETSSKGNQEKWYDFGTNIFKNSFDE